MMFDYIGWEAATKVILKALFNTYKQKSLTRDFAQMAESANEVTCSDFAQAIVINMRAPREQPSVRLAREVSRQP